MSVCDPQQVQMMQDDVNLFSLTLITIFSPVEKEIFQAQHEVTSMLIKSNYNLLCFSVSHRQMYPSITLYSHGCLEENGIQMSQRYIATSCFSSPDNVVLMFWLGLGKDHVLV